MHLKSEGNTLLQTCKYLFKIALQLIGTAICMLQVLTLSQKPRIFI